MYGAFAVLSEKDLSYSSLFFLLFPFERDPQNKRFFFFRPLYTQADETGAPFELYPAMENKLKRN